MSEHETKPVGLAHAETHAQLDAFGHGAAAVPVGDVGPVARTTDPETSHRAARAASKGVTLAQLAVLHVFQWCHAEAPRTESVLTHETLIRRYTKARGGRIASRAWYPDLTESSIRTRCKELVTRGYVCHVDDGGVNERGRKCARWACTPAGLVFDVDGRRAR